MYYMDQSKVEYEWFNVGAMNIPEEIGSYF